MKDKIVKSLLNTKLLLALISGISLGMGFIYPLLSVLVILGIAINIIVILQTSSYKQAITTSLLIWFVRYLIVLSWIVSVYPLNWLNIESNWHQLSLIALYWSTGALWLSLGGIFLGLAIFFLKSKISQWLLFISIPFIWLLAELVGALSFSFFTIGVGSFIQTYMSMGQVGYLLVDTPVASILAPTLGLYGLTIILVAVASLFNFLFINKKYKKMAGAIVVLLLAFVFGHFYSQNVIYNVKGITILSVGTNFSLEKLQSAEDYSFKNEEIKKAVKAATKLEPNYILLPEDSRYFTTNFPYKSDEGAMSVFQFTHQNTNSILIDSGRQELLNGQTVLRASIFDGQAKKIFHFDKQYLVPQGEYMPYLYQYIISFSGYKDSVSKLNKKMSYERGPLDQDVVVPDYLPAVLFCFESVQVGRVKELESYRDLSFVAHPISHAWFNNSRVLEMQLDRMLKLQAVESGVPIVTSANQADNKMYLPDGTISHGEEVMREGNWYITKFSL